MTTEPFKPGQIVCANAHAFGLSFWKANHAGDASRHRFLAPGDVFMVLGEAYDIDFVRAIDTAGLVGLVTSRGTYWTLVGEVVK